MAKEFAGRYVVVTGGNSGIGLATARAFADEGARVAIVGRDPATLERARAQIGGDTLAVRADLSALPQIEAAFAEIGAAFGGRVDALFANAGGGALVPFEQVDEALFDQVMSLNIKGTFFTVQHCLPLMGPGAAVVLCSSVSAARAMPGSTIYAASKAAINALGRGLAAELAGRSIRVNVVMPGGVATPIMHRTPGVPPGAADAVFEQMAAGTPLGRVARPEEVAASVLFLCSAKASYITATELHVDGGVIGAT